MQGVKHCLPQQASELVLAWVWEKGPKGSLCPRMNHAMQQRQREQEGVRNAVLSNTCTPHAPLAKPPAWTYRNRTDPHYAPYHSAGPEGSFRKAQEFRMGIRQGLQLGGEFLPSFVLPSHCLELASPCSLSGSTVLPVQCFDIGFAQGQGSAGLWHLSLTGNELQTAITIKVKI